MIDSGESLERYQWMLRGYLAAIERAEIALSGITHHHLDHSGNLKWLREVYKADVLVHLLSLDFDSVSHRNLPGWPHLYSQWPAASIQWKRAAAG